MTQKIGEWSISGMSVASRCTCIIIKELKLCFDMGCIIDGIDNIRTVLISHGHTDHIGCLNYFLSYCDFRNLSKPHCIMPNICLSPFKILCSASSALDRGTPNTTIFESLTKCDLIDGDIIDKLPMQYNQNYVISSMHMNHKIPSLGYCVYSKRHKLKEEYKSYAKENLKALRFQGISLTNEIYVPEISFTGDSLFSAIADKPDLLVSKLLIMECTFLSDVSVEEAHDAFHVHITEISQNNEIFFNDNIILTHFSDRYSLDEILDEVNKNFKSTPLWDKIYVLHEASIIKINNNK